MYKYEMHCHTADSSRCSHISAADLVDCYKKMGYDAIVVTDHFFNNGSTVAPKDLPWNERVSMLLRGYKAALARGTEVGIDVHLGWEVTHRGTDLLTYGLDENWLLRHEDCDLLTLNDYCDLVHESGGYMVHAHPFREADYIDYIRLLPRKVDAVETINACRTEFENKMANQYADSYSLPKMCGSDNHKGYQERVAALLLDFKAENSAEIMKAVMENRHKREIYDVLL